MKGLKPTPVNLFSPLHSTDVNSTASASQAVLRVGVQRNKNTVSALVELFVYHA